MRTLIQIRTIHTPSDMGSMSDALIQETVDRVGYKRWKQNARKIEAFWDRLEGRIRDLNLDWREVRIYQDGLPDVGDEMGIRIVRDAADKGSRNYRLIKGLAELGARIEGTEDPQLLKGEYDHIEAIANAKSAKERADAWRRYGSVKKDLIDRRDDYIAKKIHLTLQEGGIGLLFIGAAHDLARRLPEDIQIRELS